MSVWYNAGNEQRNFGTAEKRSRAEMERLAGGAKAPSG